MACSEENWRQLTNKHFSILEKPIPALSWRFVFIENYVNSLPNSNKEKFSRSDKPCINISFSLVGLTQVTTCSYIDLTVI